MNRAITLVLVIAVILNMTAAIRFIAFPNLDLIYLVLIAVAVAIGIVFSAIIALQNASLNAPLWCLKAPLPDSFLFRLHFASRLPNALYLEMSIFMIQDQLPAEQPSDAACRHMTEPGRPYAPR